MSDIIVFGARGTGSDIIEVALVLAGLDYAFEECAYWVPGPGRDKLFALNPVGQLPTVRWVDGTILTESLAILQAIDDVRPEAGLVPPRGAPERLAYLRWSTFIVAAIYPTFTVADDPERWVEGAAEASRALRESMFARRESLYRLLDAHAMPAGPWFLGERMSAIDLYVAVMNRWRPRSEWFAANTPRLHAIAVSLRARPELAPILTGS